MGTTKLENRVSGIADKAIRNFTDRDLYAICKNVINAHGENPTDSEIIKEIAEYYF